MPKKKAARKATPKPAPPKKVTQKKKAAICTKPKTPKVARKAAPAPEPAPPPRTVVIVVTTSTEPTPKPKAPPKPKPAPVAVPAGFDLIEVRENRYHDGESEDTQTRRVPILKLTGDSSGYFFRASMNIDAAGAPRCYHPTDDSLALDDKANSSSPSRQFIQGENGIGPASGFYVSQTSLNKGPENRCDSFVDAVEMPYFVFPSQFHGASLGDVAMVYNTKNRKLTHAIFAETNPRVGGASIKTARNLGIPNATPRQGINDARFIYLVFPGSKIPPSHSLPHWTDSSIRQNAEARFAAWGGLAKLQEIAKKI
jgi:hypothetical protein